MAGPDKITVVVLRDSSIVSPWEDVISYILSTEVLRENCGLDKVLLKYGLIDTLFYYKTEKVTNFICITLLSLSHYTKIVLCGTNSLPNISPINHASLYCFIQIIYGLCQ